VGIDVGYAKIQALRCFAVVGEFDALKLSAGPYVILCYFSISVK